MTNKQKILTEFREKFPNDRYYESVDFESFLIQSIEEAEKNWAKQCGKEQSCSMCLEHASLSPQKDHIMQEEIDNIGQLRQWLNEDRITDPKKMVTNEEIETYCFDKDCPLYVIGAVHEKGITICKHKSVN